MTPFEPIPESVEALDELDPSRDADDLLAHLRELANRAQDVLPDLVGVSVARFDHGLTFTLVATDDEVAVLDAIQYVAGGPCVDAAHDTQVREFKNDDVLSETRWQMFAEATAARALRSTLTLPLVGPDGGAMGTVNLYAGSPRAFVGRHEKLADLFGAWAAGAVANADLSFMTRRTAQEAPGRVREAVTIDTAVGILAASRGVDIETAERRLRTAAQHAGVSVGELAGRRRQLQPTPKAKRRSRRLSATTRRDATSRRRRCPFHYARPQHSVAAPDRDAAPPSMPASRPRSRTQRRNRRDVTRPAMDGVRWLSS